jgi:iron complex outermembrane receptor protein
MLMVKCFRFWFLVAFIAGLPFMANSQSIATDTLEIESISIFRSKNSIGYLPGTKVETIDTVVLNEKASLSLAELLGENSPIFIKTYGRGATATASFRGTGASHTQVFWNGLKINSPMSGQVDFSQIPLYFVDNVSIHFGQSSMNFGSGGLGGSVNLASSPDWSKKSGAKVYQSVGSFGSYSTGLNATFGNSKIKLQTRIFRESSQNNFTYQNKARQGYPVEIQENADYLNYGILQEVYYRPTSNNIISLRLWAQENERGIPRLMSNYSVEEKNRQNDRNLNSIADWSYYGNSTKITVSTGLSALNLDYVYSKYSNEDFEQPIINAESQSLSWSNKVGVERNIFQWLQANVDLTHCFQKVSSSDLILLTGYNGQQHQAAIKMKLNATPNERLSLSLLLNEESQGDSFSPLMPLLSAEYSLFKNGNLKLKGAVARNYHYPSLNDLYWHPGGNKNLLPENGFTYEGGIKFSSNPTDYKVDLDLTLFTSEIENWIMWLPHLKGYWEPINLRLVQAQGVEASVAVVRKVERLTLKLLGNYSYTRSSIENAGGVIRPESHGKQLPFIPVHSGGIVINALWKKFYFIYSFTHFSERFTTTSNNPNSFRRLYPYYMSSVSVGKDFSAFKSRFGIQLRVDNLLDESYQSILWRPMPGRNYSLLFRVDL